MTLKIININERGIAKETRCAISTCQKMGILSYIDVVESAISKQ
jgi:hypothetical protein